jgi:L-lactate dehydrogenase complex protein LldG
MSDQDRRDRDRILGKMRAALRPFGDEAARRAAAAARLRAHPRATLPASDLTPDSTIALFTEKLSYQGADISRAEDGAGAVAAIADYLRAQNLTGVLRMGEDAQLGRLPWAERPQIEIVKGPAHATDRVSLSHAFGGAAETGTLFLLSGAGNPTTLNFLPEVHMVVIEARRIFANYEPVWDLLRERGAMPRAVNLISGPSRTADIEQTIIKGAHGPRKLHVVILAAPL